MTNYIPNEVDKLWARKMVDAIRNGGILAYPATELIYRLDQTAQILTLTNPEQLEFQIPNEIHERTKVVFREIGWEVTP